MKSLIFKILCIPATFSTLIAVSCSRYESVPGDPLETKIYTLDNGLQVYMSVNKEQPRIQTYIAVKVGSKNDPAQTTGLAHYFEHLMFKGTQSFGTVNYQAEKPMLDEIEQLFELYRSTRGENERAAIYHQIDSISYEASKLAIPNEYDKLMSMIGAEGTNAWTSSDETVYTENIPSNQIDNWSRIQADRFRNTVIRGFHTELETIYEEKNMSLTQDRRKVWEELDKALFPHHPYGQQTTLGTQEHLKNPSITNVKKYHDTYYVPNNIRICVSGDFDPDEMVAAIEKYWGDWQSNPSVPKLEFEAESPITEPIVREVYGLEAENVAMGWRLPGAPDLHTCAVAEIAGAVLNNGSAGLIDLDVIQQQKVLSLGAGFSSQPDYSMFIAMGSPKEGQSLEEVRDIALEEFARLRKGDFDASLIKATASNLRLALMRMLEDNSSRAALYVDAFINGIEWKDACKELELLSSVTKEDVVAFANEYLGDQAYAIIYKRQGEDTTVMKISAPAITPIVTNRDSTSAFLREIQASAVKPIEPVFVDFSKDMSRFDLSQGVNVLYKTNETNDIFTLKFIFNTGREDNPQAEFAWDYLTYLGTADMSAEQFASQMYALACSFSVYVGDNSTTISVSGLNENMEEAVGLVEKLIKGAVGDEHILANIKDDTLKDRKNAKTRQRSCFNALTRYVKYGPEYVARTVLGNEDVMALTSEGLLSTVRDVFAKGHEILYYGPRSADAAKNALLACHGFDAAAKALPERFSAKMLTATPEVVVAPYDAKQIYYYQYSNRGETFQKDAAASTQLYNEYFGGGMNTIVFQEMREARGLAYSAWAWLRNPSFADDTYSYDAFIATQNDKMKIAVEAFDQIINEMPRSEAAFKIAKDALTSRLRTSRINGMDVLQSYRACRRLGLNEPQDREVFEQIDGMTLQDVVSAQEKWAKDRTYTYAILGDIDDLDKDFLASLGPVKILALENIFGF